MNDERSTMKIGRYIEEDGVRADYGLAVDEWLLRHHGRPGMEPGLHLYTYRPAALVGRFQNVAAEVNLEVCRQRGVAVGRRLTGGGAIAMGEGQLGLALAAPSERLGARAVPDVFRSCCKGILWGLEAFGVKAELAGKNDLSVGGRKIAGLAAAADEQGGVLFQASVLVDLDLELIRAVLRNPSPGDKEMPGADLGERLTSLRRETGREILLSQFRSAVRRGFEEAIGSEFEARSFDEEELESIHYLARARYGSMDWLFQRAACPALWGTGQGRTEAGLVRAYVTLREGTLDRVWITGDFFGHPEAVRELEDRLHGCPAEAEPLSLVLEARPEAEIPLAAVLEAILDASADAAGRGEE